MKVHIKKWTLAKEFFSSSERRIFFDFFNPTFIWYTPSAGQDFTGSLWRRLRNTCWRGSYLFLLINAKVSLSDRFWYFPVNKKINHAYIYHQGKCLWIWKWINWRFKKKNLRRVVAGLDESASASTETQNYTEPYVEEPLADEEWLQNYRKEQEDKEGLARELKSTLMSVPVSESHPPSTIFSFCCSYNTESHTLWSETSTVKKFYRAFFYQDKICSHFFFFFEVLRFASRRIPTYTYSFFRTSCVVTSSGYASFRHFQGNYSLLYCLCRYSLFTWSHVFLNLRHSSIVTGKNR